MIYVLLSLVLSVVMLGIYYYAFSSLLKTLKSNGVEPRYLSPSIWIPFLIFISLWTIPSVFGLAFKIDPIGARLPTAMALVVGILSLVFLLVEFIGLIIFLVLEILYYKNKERLENLLQEREELKGLMYSKPVIGTIQWIIGLVLFFYIFFPLYLMRRFYEFDILKEGRESG